MNIHKPKQEAVVKRRQSNIHCSQTALDEIQHLKYFYEIGSRVQHFQLACCLSREYSPACECNRRLEIFDKFYYIFWERKSIRYFFHI